MNKLLIILQIVISVLLIGAILIQARGTGFGRVWGTGPKSFTRRGLEKLVFKLTFVLSLIFIAVSIISLAI